MPDNDQPSRTYTEALERAARLWGIEPEYGDTWGKLHATTPETQKGILTALGVATDTKEALDRAVARRLSDEWDRPLPPVCVIGESRREDGFPLNVPEALAAAAARIEIRWEDGTACRFDVDLAALAITDRANVCGRRYLRKQVPIPPGRPGYHDVEVTIGDRRASMRLILCPDRAWTPPATRNGNRTAGLALALYGLRSGRNWGCGDFTDLERATDWIASEIGAGFIGLNPLHAIPNRYPYNISPYLPASTFYKNPIYLDLERIDDFRASPRVAAWFRRPEVQGEIERLRAAEFVEYDRVYALKLRGLKLAFAHFLREYRAGSPRVDDFRQFNLREGELLDRFATWCALDDWIHRRHPDIWLWPDWPEPYREPDSDGTRAFAAKHWRLVLFYKYAQWQVDQQLAHAQRHARERGLAIGLFHDLALATDRYGADLWAHRPFYVDGCRVGAPPDNFSPKGQDWSFPPPNTEHHRQTGYRLFTESIRKNCRHGGALRIDHVMRFFRLYWIPEGFDPAHGAYVRDYSEDLLHILALESVRNQVAIVGEDLGTVTSEMRRALDRFGIYGYKVPYFEKLDNGDFKVPQLYPCGALVASSTHDLPTLAGFWLGRDIEERRRCGLLPGEEAVRRQFDERAREKQLLLDALFEQGLLPDWFPRRAEQVLELTGELHNALVGWLALAPSHLLALNQEDLFKEADQQNLPATTSEHPNWRHKMRYTVEDLGAGAARDYTAMFRNWLARTGRAGA
ncbi:MAG: 4-alpha-glucanotransferase [Acidobacteriota bacterium]